MAYVREVTKLTIITLAYIDYFLPIIRIDLHGVVVVLVNYESMCPGFESRKSHYIFFFIYFFYIFFVIIITVQFCKFNITVSSVSTTSLLLMMPRPPAPSAL